MKVINLNPKDFIEVTKPGIIRGNLIVALAAFIFASGDDIDFVLLCATLLGIGLVIASAAVANNYIDRNIDSKMERTNKRSIVTGRISGQSALIYSLTLGILGVYLLTYFVNIVTAAIGVISFMLYVFVYAYFKRLSTLGTLIGAIPGAAAPLAGYTAVTASLDLISMLLFAILFFWQMPHFYSIAIFRKDDYKKAGIPVLPIIKGNLITKKQTLAFIGLFIFSNMLLFAFNQTGYVYLVVMSALNVWWAKIAFDGFDYNIQKDDSKWAIKMFKFSLLVLTTYSLLLIVNNFIP